MSVGNRKGPLLESGLCRCCGMAKRCRILNAEYDWQGQKEIYSDMFVDCFGLLLSHLDGEDTERAICATCVTRLREAVAFRRQVLVCEEKLLLVKLRDDETSIKTETCDDVKREPAAPSPEPYGDMDRDDCRDDDDICLATIKTEQEKLMKHKKRKLAKSELTSKMKRKDVINTKMKRLLQRKLKETKKELELINDTTQCEPQQPRPKIIENEQKTYSNTVTIVENSYVCPFYTSFSDYYCMYCRETFTDPEKLREHTLEHDPMNFKHVFDNKKLAQIDILRIDCRLCPVRIDTIENLKEHLQNTHGKLIYQVKNEFLKFKLTTTNLTCMECNLNHFKYFHALKKHMAEHFGTCICDICGAHYFEERVLLIHQKTHQSIEEVYPCKFCGKTFKSRHNRYLHEAKVHKKEAAYPCSKCDEVFFSHTLRYRHLIEHHGVERTFRCEICDRIYDSRKSLREHNRRSHLKIMKHQCDLCDRRFYLPSRLKEHMSTHTGERNYRCEYCGKSYPRLRGLKVHMQSHITEKKFRCVLCSASFTQNVNLRNHMKRQHQSIDVDDNYHVGL